MSEKDGKKPRELVEITNLQEALSTLKQGAKFFSNAMFWTKGQEAVYHSHLSLFSEVDRVFYVSVPAKDFESQSFKDALSKQKSYDLYFSVSLTHANIFFRARYIGYDAGGLKFELPEKIFKVQRRKDVRFTIRDGHLLKIKFKDPIFPETEVEKKAFDISAGGLSIIVSPEEEVLFQPGLTLKGLRFTIQNRSIECEGEVRHSLPLPKSNRPPGVKVGILFRSIRAGDAQHIATYIFEESRKYYSRFM